jgi:hypothetical protein
MTRSVKTLQIEELLTSKKPLKENKRMKRTRRSKEHGKVNLQDSTLGNVSTE